MSELLAEVDEVMRQERIMAFWKENGKMIIAFVAMVIIGTAASSLYRTWDLKTRQADTSTVLSLMENPAFPENVKLEELDIRPGLKGVALMSAARAYMAQGKTEQAMDMYDHASADKKIPDDIRQLATLMSVRLQATQEEPPADLQARLEAIWSDDDSPWRYHARLEAATLYAHEDQNYAKAREHLAEILSASGLPDTLNTTARALDHVYALQAQEQKKTEAVKEGS